MAKSGTSFKPGESGNPGGRPKKDDSITFSIRKFMNKRAVNPKTGRKVKNKQLFIETLFNRSLTEDGDTAAKILLNYHDGMPPQQIKMNQNNSSDQMLQVLRAILEKDDDRVKSDLRQRLSKKPVSDQEQTS